MDLGWKEFILDITKMFVVKNKNQHQLHQEYTLTWEDKILRGILILDFIIKVAINVEIRHLCM